MSALTVTAVVLAGLLGGHHYLYCRVMEQVMSSENCACARVHNDQEEQSIEALDDCFEVRAFAQLTSFTVAPDIAVPPAGLVAILPPVSPIEAPSDAVLSDGDHLIRAGPFSPAASRARLMVFLT